MSESKATNEDFDDLFQFTLEPATESAGGQPPDGGKTVLIIDDSELTRVAVRIAVEELGHQAVDAANGDEALNAAQSNVPDLIVLDWVMPEKDGLQTLKELRAIPELMETPVVLLTVVRDAKAIREAGVYNVRDYLSKPARPERLRAKIQKYLG